MTMDGKWTIDFNFSVFPPIIIATLLDIFFQVICPGRGISGGLQLQQLRARGRSGFNSKHRCCQLRHMKSKRREGDHLDWKQQNVAICTLPGSPTHFQVIRGTWLIYTSLFKRHSFKCIVKLAGTKNTFVLLLIPVDLRLMTEKNTFFQAQFSCDWKTEEPKNPENLTKDCTEGTFWISLWWIWQVVFT